MPEGFSYSVITPAQLRRAGEALYGRWWITALATDLGVSKRSVQYMDTGKIAISKKHVDRLLEVIKARRTVLWDVGDEIADAVKPYPERQKA